MTPTNIVELHWHQIESNLPLPLNEIGVVKTMRRNQIDSSADYLVQPKAMPNR